MINIKKINPIDWFNNEIQKIYILFFLFLFLYTLIHNFNINYRYFRFEVYLTIRKYNIIHINTWNNIKLLKGYLIFE